MRVEEIALRHEIRQMLNEAGFNKNTLKDLVKEVLNEEIEKAITQAINESDLEGYIKDNIDSIIHKKTKYILEDKITNQIVGSWFSHMKVDVKITGEENLYPKNEE